jgi:hypothetical protein
MKTVARGLALTTAVGLLAAPPAHAAAPTLFGRQPELHFSPNLHPRTPGFPRLFHRPDGTLLIMAGRCPTVRPAYGQGENRY